MVVRATSPASIVPLLFSLLGCASKAPNPAEAKSSAPELSGPETECVARAQAERSVPATSPARISVSHILVRHFELERPQGATRSRGEACLRALQALEALQGGAEWAAVVNEFSDSGQSNGGDLGSISQEDVTPPFARAAFGLESNELSYVVETDRGFHVILRH